jgi:hypothetical protein
MAKIEILPVASGGVQRGTILTPLGEGSYWVDSIMHPSLTEIDEYKPRQGLIEPFVAALRVGLVKGLEQEHLEGLAIALVDGAYNEAGSTEQIFIAIGFAIASLTKSVVSTPHVSVVSLAESLMPFRKFIEMARVAYFPGISETK